MQLLRKVLKILAFVLAVPFITYGFLGLIRFIGVDNFIESYLGAYNQPLVALLLVVIGCCLLYGLNALAERIK